MNDIKNIELVENKIHKSSHKCKANEGIVFNATRYEDGRKGNQTSLLEKKKIVR